MYNLLYSLAVCHAFLQSANSAVSSKSLSEPQINVVIKLRVLVARPCGGPMNSKEDNLDNFRYPEEEMETTEKIVRGFPAE